MGSQSGIPSHMNTMTNSLSQPQTSTGNNHNGVIRSQSTNPKVEPSSPPASSFYHIKGSYIKQSNSPVTTTSSPPGSSQNSSRDDGSPTHMSSGGIYGGHSQHGQLSPQTFMDPHNYGSVASATANFPWHSTMTAAEFHNGCVQRASPMTYPTTYKGAHPCYPQTYASAPYYDYFSQSHHHPHHAHQFGHHQMTNPYTISGSHPSAQHNFSGRSAVECTDIYGNPEKYQVL